jgi:hypothetical protein
MILFLSVFLNLYYQNKKEKENIFIFLYSIHKIYKKFKYLKLF